MAKPNDTERHDPRGAASQKDDERDRQLARGRVPIDCADGEDGLYLEATDQERREAIRKLGSADKAINEAMGVLYSIKGLGEILVQDTVRDRDDWVLAIGNSVIEQAGRMIDFLDRSGGWPDRTQ